MRKSLYILYAVYAVVVIALKIAGLAGWWLATSFLWFPLGVFFCLSLGMMLTTDLGRWMKKKKEEKIKPSCENCLFRHSQKLTGREKCRGEEEGAEMKDGICSYYSKHIM